jgi:thioredoxin reductase
MISIALKVARGVGAKVDSRKIVRLINNEPSHEEGVTIEFDTGDPVTVGFIVHRPATVNRSQHLIEQLGIETVDPAIGGHIKVTSQFNETSVRGVFAAGDTMVVMKQAVIAMAEGLKAASGAGQQMQQEKAEIAIRKFDSTVGEADNVPVIA